VHKMPDTQKLLAVKKDLRKRRPEFIRQDSWLRTRIGNNPKWRRPKGKHSKMREKRVGKHARVEIGYRGPAQVRGLTLTGMAPKIIHNLEELQRLNAKTDIAILSSAIGLKAKIEITKKAQELGIKTNTKTEKLNARLAELKKEKLEREQAAKKEKAAPATAEKTEKKAEQAQPAAASAAATTQVTEKKTETQKQTQPKQKTERAAKSDKQKTVTEKHGP